MQPSQKWSRNFYRAARKSNTKVAPQISWRQATISLDRIWNSLSTEIIVGLSMIHTHRQHSWSRVITLLSLTLRKRRRNSTKSIRIKTIFWNSYVRKREDWRYPAWRPPRSSTLLCLTKSRTTLFIALRPTNALKSRWKKPASQCTIQRWSLYSRAVAHLTLGDPKSRKTLMRASLSANRNQTKR